MSIDRLAPGLIKAMIRCIIWRLLFEVCNIRRLFGHGPERVQYLAFGANLSDIVLRRRRITPLASQPFTLRDYGLRFDHPSRWVDCGYASAESAPGESVHGYLYTLSGRDAARMDYYEVVPILKRYRRTFVEQDGVRLFFYQTNHSTEGLSPSTEYLGYIVKGLQSHPDVHPEYQAELAATTTVEQDRFVLSYLWSQPADQARLSRRLGELYQHFVSRIFLEFLYKYSITVFLIRK